MTERWPVRVPAGALGEFSSPLLGVHPTPVLSQWHAKHRGHSAKSAGSRLLPNTHTPLTQRSRNGLTMLSRYSVGTYQGKRVHTQLVTGNTRPQSSQLAEPLSTDPCLTKKKKWNWCARAYIHLYINISFLKKKKKRGRGINRQTFPPNPRKRGKDTSRWRFFYFLDTEM